MQQIYSFEPGCKIFPITQNVIIWLVSIYYRAFRYSISWYLIVFIVLNEKMNTDLLPIMKHQERAERFKEANDCSINFNQASGFFIAFLFSVLLLGTMWSF